MTHNQSYSSPKTAFRARWVFPIEAPPIEFGVVTVAGGRIVDLGVRTDVAEVTDLGDVALIPGLVNAHTHLEFSDLTAPLGTPGMAFSAWIAQVVERRRQAFANSTPAELQQARSAAVRQGLSESLAAGVVALGEIATSPWDIEPFLASPAESLDVTVFLEALGLAAARQEPLEAAAHEHLARVVDSARHAPLHMGLSPHAPYTVRPDLVRRWAAISRDRGAPLAMHLAESFEEIELLASHSGGLVEQLGMLGAWDPAAVPRGIRPVNYLERLADAARALVIHGNFLGPLDWEFLAQRRARMSVVYCPRTHAYFSHGDYPLAEMLEAGVRVAVGTDSRATNPDLNLWNDLRFVAARHPAVALEKILELGTLAAAAALGIDTDYGSLAPGKRSELAIVELSTPNAEPFEALFTSEVCRRFTAGSW